MDDKYYLKYLKYKKKYLELKGGVTRGIQITESVSPIKKIQESRRRELIPIWKKISNLENLWRPESKISNIMVFTTKRVGSEKLKPFVREVKRILSYILNNLSYIIVFEPDGRKYITQKKLNQMFPKIGLEYLWNKLNGSENLGKSFVIILNKVLFNMASILQAYVNNQIISKDEFDKLYPYQSFDKLWDDNGGSQYLKNGFVKELNEIISLIREKLKELTDPV